MTSATTRLTRLLDRGFYPVELPPSFRTHRFSSIGNTLNPKNGYYGSTTFFDGATFRGHLRTFGVINPANYFLLSQFIANNWADIAKVYRLSSCSGSRPKFPRVQSDGRAIETASLAAKRQNQQHLASSFPIILNLDINRFYGSIYTHSLPWAVLGKQEAKRRYSSGALTGHWSDQLDRLVRSCNQRQTVGIPIGPDTSRIISELLLSRIDFELCSKGTGITSAQVYHNIDDYQIGAFETGFSENAQSQFVRSISRYELRLNDFKTSVQQGVEFKPSNFQRQFDVLQGKSSRAFVEHFFDLVYTASQLNYDSNVVGYALKRFGRALAANNEQPLVREYLQRLLFTGPFHARWIFPILLGIYHQTGTNPEIRRVISWGIEVCARRNDAISLLWFLYAAIFLNIRLSTSSCNQCFGISNALVDIVLFHGKSLGLFSISVGVLRSRYLKSDYSSPDWLPLYEIERRGWDTSPAFTKLGQQQDHLGLYEHMRTNDVEFYLTDNEVYTVEAFDGWNLTQESFTEEAHFEDYAHDLYDYVNDWENYE